MQSQGYRKHTTEQILRAIELCPTIDKLFEIVKNEQIPDLSPLDSLKIRVRQAVMDAARLRGEVVSVPAPAVQPVRHTKEQLIRAVQTCPTIDKLFELVKNEHIVIRMKSFNSASGLPQHRLSGEELKPDKSPLDRLKEQVLDAVMNSN